MDWILIIALLVAAYALAAYYIHSRKLWQDHITFYGPLMAIKTERVGFFDRFLPFSTFLRLYGTLGVVMVVVVSVLMTVMLFLAVQNIVVQRPGLTMANDPKNILAFPGVNDFIPFTFAVWFGLIITMIVHEFGHAILCRVEGIRVKTMGVLLAVIPIGAFVEPDEEDQEKSRGLAKMRMFGAGITNNIVLGLLCFGALILLLGFIVPLNAPLVHGVYVDSPAYAAGISPNSVIREVNGVSVATRDDVTMILNTTKPGDTVTLVIDNQGKSESHTLTLTSWPKEQGQRTSGYMGIVYYSAPAVKEEMFSYFREPVGLIILLALPLYTVMEPATWGPFNILKIDTVDAMMWQVPFPHFWFVIQILFWCGWFNMVVGTFNALPLLPLDGGLILKEGVDRILERRGWLQYSGYVVGAVSYTMILVLAAVVVLPFIINMPK
nr:site-2 protease family protein [uncultured Methanoregula sp.]